MTDDQFSQLMAAIHLYGEAIALGVGFLVGLQLWRLVLLSKMSKFF